MGSVTHCIPPSKRGQDAVANRRRKHVLTRLATYRLPGCLVYSQIKSFFRAQQALEGHQIDEKHISQYRVCDRLEHRYPMQGQGYHPEMRGALGQWLAVHVPGAHDLVDCRRDTWAERAMLFAFVADT